MAPISPADDTWRATHLGRWLGHALRRFDDRVLQLMAASPRAPLALSRLAERAQISAAHIHLTRHLPLDGARPGELAQAAGMTAQAMGALIEQGLAWGLIERTADPRDARARWLRFTPLGLDWLAAFEDAVRQAQDEFRAEVGDAVATVVALGLEAYAGAAASDAAPPDSGSRSAKQPRPKPSAGPAKPLKRRAT